MSPEILAALQAFPEDDERHWQLWAFLFNLLAHKMQTKADNICRDRTAQQVRLGV
jgi:hypothetical protein